MTEATEMVYRIGEIIYSLPYEQRLATRKAICEKLDITSQRLSQIINSVGKKKASGEQLEVIASALNVEVKELIR